MPATCFPVVDLAKASAQHFESLGTKEKFWLSLHEEGGTESKLHLFKMGRLGTGENWAEKITSELAALLNLPCARYELAILDGRRGVLTENFVPYGGQSLLGNTLLARIDASYDGTARFKQLRYRLSTVVNTLSLLPLLPPLGTAHEVSAVDHFVGYLMFDAFCGNTDRHHENWGLIIAGEPRSFHLAPSFDHASSLGRDQSDERRRFRMVTADARASVEAYAGRARCAFFGPSTGRTLLMSELVTDLWHLKPSAARYWTERITSVPDVAMQDLFGRVPTDWISSDAIEFALRMMRSNRNMLKEVASGR